MTTRGPVLMSINFKTGDVRRYQMHFNLYEPGTGWRPKLLSQAHVDLATPLGDDAWRGLLERFRTTGVTV